MLSRMANDKLLFSELKRRQKQREKEAAKAAKAASAAANAGSAAKPKSSEEGEEELNPNVSNAIVILKFANGG